MKTVDVHRSAYAGMIEAARVYGKQRQSLGYGLIQLVENVCPQIEEVPEAGSPLGRRDRQPVNWQDHVSATPGVGGSLRRSRLGRLGSGPSTQFIEQRRRFRYGRRMLMPYKGRLPEMHPSAYVSPSAQVIGDVVIGAQSSVWFNVVIRGDVHEIRIGARTNIQDNSTVHVTRGRWGTFVGNEVSVAHGVILHGCRVGNRCLIGMGAIVMDGVEVEEECMIAAGSLVTPGKTIPRGHLVMGNPAKVVRQLRPEELAQIRSTAEHYVEYAAAYRQA